VRIVAAAARTFNRDRDAAMDRVAEVAGVHRATLYRHFPTRSELLEAVLDDALIEGRRIVEMASALVPNEDAVHDFASHAVHFGDKYAFLIGTPTLAAAGPDPIGLSRLMESWQYAGLLRDDVNPVWLARNFIVLTQTTIAVPEVADGQRREDLLTRFFLHGAAR
jgi:AcrR family transcriptional regulator